MVYPRSAKYTRETNLIKPETLVEADLNLTDKMTAVAFEQTTVQVTIGAGDSEWTDTIANTIGYEYAFIEFDSLVRDATAQFITAVYHNPTTGETKVVLNAAATADVVMNLMFLAEVSP